MMNKFKKCLNDEIIEKFAKNEHTIPDLLFIKEHIEQCKKCYEKYIEFKELLYFKTKRVKIKKNILNNLVELYDKFTQKKEIIKRFSVIINSTRKALEVFTDSNFELKSDFVSAAIIVKGKKMSKVEGDVITLTKKVDNYSIDLKIGKIKKGEFKLSVFIFKKNCEIKDLRVYLKIRGQEIESIILAENNQFKYALKPEKYILKFTQNNRTLFVIDLKIKSE